jgi:prefoldin subunit 5
VEKQCRLAGDVAGTRKAAVDIVELCFKDAAWKTLNDQIVVLSKRRGQLKQAITAVVQKAMEYIDVTPDVDTRIELIKTLSSVAAGKIYVEIERARLIKRLAKIKEELGKIDEAADLMQEVAVETFGSMAKTEKLHSFWSRFGCVWIVKIMSGHKYYPGKLALGSLMQIHQRKKRNQKMVIIWFRKPLRRYRHS